MSLKDLIQSLDYQKEGLVVLESAQIKALHKALLQMLQDFNDLCHAYDIGWCLAGGSMLGAVRNGNFIAWDDDVDIHMTRPEFERLRSLLTRQTDYCVTSPNSLLTSFLQKYFLCCPGDQGYLYHYPKIFLKNSVFREIQSCESMPDQLFMDIFILEDTYDSPVLNQIHGVLCSFYLLVVSAIRTKKCATNLLYYSHSSPAARKAIKLRAFLGGILSFRSAEHWLKDADACFSRARNHNSKELCIPTGVKHFYGERYKRGLFSAFFPVKFAGLQLPVPVQAEEILRQRYGENYMEEPPQSEQVRHALIELKLPDIHEIASR